MKMELNAYEITEAIQDYLVKRGVRNPEGDCFTDCLEMSFSTTEVTRQPKKHKNGKPVMVKHGEYSYPEFEIVSTKTVWHQFYEDSDLSIWI